MASSIWLIPVTACMFAAIFLPILIRLAPHMGLLDHPGGRKDHACATPVVGGIAILSAVLVTCMLLKFDSHVVTLLICAVPVFLAGMLDDMRELPQYPRFAAQILACGLVLWLLEIPLRSVGNLLGLGPIGLWIFAYPMTVFAVVGVINAVNMSDGLDGLAGMQCLIAVSAYGWVAHVSGQASHVALMLALGGALVAFLALNLRLPWQTRAQAFMGDAGSMTIGFLLGWMAVDLTQGAGHSFPPICALWVVVIPLCDTVSLILRRRAAGRSPMAPDREHLHHQLLARGHSVSRTVLLLAIANAVCALIGIGGWMLSVPEPLLFALFVALFLAHHHSSKRFWKRHRLTGIRADGSPVTP